MATSPSSIPPATRALYWRRTQRLTLILSCVWLLITVSVVFFARPLSAISLFGWPLSYYLAGQGAIFMYVILVPIYIWRMSKIDKLLKSEDSDGK